VFWVDNDRSRPAVDRMRLSTFLILWRFNTYFQDLISGIKPSTLDYTAEELSSEYHFLVGSLRPTVQVYLRVSFSLSLNST
jgi:hypothetical protein